MPSAIELNNRLLSAEYYFATLMDQVVDISMQLEPVDEAFIARVDELYYTIEAVRFFVNRGIGTENSECMAVYNKMMLQIGINTTLPTLTVDTSLILVNPTLNTFFGNFVPYIGADNDVTLGEYGLQAGRIQLDTSPTRGTGAVGEFIWNNTDGTADLKLKGGNVTLQVGQELVARVVNKTNTNLLESQYKVVRVRKASEGGAQGQRLAVVLATSSTELSSTDVLGVVTENISNNQEGFITTFGEVKAINTTGSLQGETWVDGDILYLSPTVPGGLTKVKPEAPNHLVIIGYVTYAHQNNGKIFVSVDTGYELDELHNVKITSVQNNDVLTYESSTSLWKNKKCPQVVTQAQRLALTPYVGMLVYQTNNTEGLYVYKSTGWTFVI